MKNSKIYELITNRIIEKLEEGTIPWRKPWINSVAVNWKTQKPYRGINTLLLDGGEYATFKQIQEAGGRVKKGAKSHIVVFWKMLEVEDENEKDKQKIIPLLRYYRVFKVGEQTEGIEPKRKEIKFVHDPIEKCEEIKRNYINSPTYSFYSGQAYYLPFEDRINVPPMSDFENVHEFYSTLFHEMIHSTGHESRLNREGIKTGKFGSEKYSKEELVAEIGASMLCGYAGIDNYTIDNSVAYIQSWLRVLKNDKTLIIRASQQAQKAVDYILGVEYSE